MKTALLLSGIISLSALPAIPAMASTTNTQQSEIIARAGEHCKKNAVSHSGGNWRNNPQQRYIYGFRVCMYEFQSKDEHVGKRMKKIVEKYNELLSTSDEVYVKTYERMYSMLRSFPKHFYEPAADSNILTSNQLKLIEIRDHVFKGDLKVKYDRIAAEEKKAEEIRLAEEKARREEEAKQRTIQQIKDAKQNGKKKAQEDHTFWTTAGNVVTVKTQREMSVGLRYGYSIIDKTWSNPCTAWGGTCGHWIYTMKK